MLRLTERKSVSEEWQLAGCPGGAKGLYNKEEMSEFDSTVQNPSH